jgi:hypothetical protein
LKGRRIFEILGDYSEDLFVVSSLSLHCGIPGLIIIVGSEARLDPNLLLNFGWPISKLEDATPACLFILLLCEGVAMGALTHKILTRL